MDTDKLQYIVETIKQCFKELILFDDKVLRSNPSCNALWEYIEHISGQYISIGVKDDSGNALFIGDQVEVWDIDKNFQGILTVIWSTGLVGYCLRNDSDYTLFQFNTSKTCSIKKHQES